MAADGGTSLMSAYSHRSRRVMNRLCLDSKYCTNAPCKLYSIHPEPAPLPRCAHCRGNVAHVARTTPHSEPALRQQRRAGMRAPRGAV
ncbi:unnamed protein product [Plutella xylostella]|uniref:(diamondback moth) hypothetical protein n=1 Tax=Plutella xylostella TaxID=51655 RepID=A0A8S4E7Z1_PLUXY|nr:unnamed protein product [Plutella xylostella]